MIYKLIKNSFGQEIGITLVGENISIPFDEANTDYQKYLQFLADGGVPEPADE